MASSAVITVGPCVASFPSLAEPKAFQSGGDANYTLNLIFKDGKGLEKLKAEASKLVKQVWGDKPPKKLRSPFRDGSEMEYEGYEGTEFIVAKRKPSFGPPAIVGPDRKPVEPHVIYAGCVVNAAVKLYTYDNTLTGVGCSLEAVQFLRDGESLGGAAPVDVDSVFDVVSDEALDSFFQ